MQMMYKFYFFLVLFLVLCNYVFTSGTGARQPASSR